MSGTGVRPGGTGVRERRPGWSRRWATGPGRAWRPGGHVRRRGAMTRRDRGPRQTGLPRSPPATAVSAILGRLRDRSQASLQCESGERGFPVDDLRADDRLGVARYPSASRRAISSLARRRSPAWSGRSQAGSGGGFGAGGRFRRLRTARPPCFTGVAAGRFGVSRAARSIRSASGDSTGPSSRAASIASRAAPSDGYGPRTSGSPNSLVWLVSTITQVPDCGSIWNRPSFDSQRPPPRRRSASGLVSAFAIGRVQPDRERAVVDQLHPHLLAESAGRHRDAEPAQRLGEAQV